LFIFLEAFRDPFVTAAEAALQSSSGTRANLHMVEATEEGLLLDESAEYTASQGRGQDANVGGADSPSPSFSPPFFFLLYFSLLLPPFLLFSPWKS
jgi:hypothetical protein